MKSIRAALALGVCAVVSLSVGLRDVEWPALFTASSLLIVCGAALALTATLPRFEAQRGALSAGAIALILIGWYVQVHTDPRLDGLPPAPLLARFLDLPPALGTALAAAGLWLLRDGSSPRNGRRLLGCAAILLVLPAVLPETVAGDLRLPISVAAGASGLATTLGTMLTAVGLFCAGAVASRTAPSARLLRAATVLVIGLVPAWLLLTGHTPAAFAQLSSGAALAASLAVLATAPAVPLAHWKPEAVAEWTAIATLSTGYWLLKIHGLGYAATDEYIYFYAARLWAEGTWPYRDFFFSHPPLHIAVPMVLFRLFGFHHLMAKLIAPGAIFLAGFVLWRGGRRIFDRLAAIVAVALFWFATEVLRSSTTFTGVELTTLFLTVGLVAALERRSWAAGIWFGMAACSGIYGVAGFLTFGVLSIAAPRRTDRSRPTLWRFDALRMAAGFFIVFVTVNLLFLAVGGSHYIDGVYRYHLLKPAKQAEQHALSEDPLALLYNVVILFRGKEFLSQLYYHSIQYCLAALAVAFAALRPREKDDATVTWSPRSWWPAIGDRFADGAVLILALSLLGTLAELGSLQERYDFYFMLTFPALALMGGFATSALIRQLDRTTTGSASPRAAWAWAAAAIACAAVPVPVALSAMNAAFPEEIEAKGSSKGAGELLRFEWTTAPVLPALGEVSRALFWSDTRVRGEIQSGVSNFLRSKKRYFATAPDIAAYVNAHTAPRDTITGASDFAPLIALLADRRLSGNEVDTNSKVFVTGVVGESDFWDRVCHDQPAYLVATNTSYFAPELLPGMRAGRIFQHERTFEDPGLRQWRTFPVQLWRRMREPPAEICD